MLLRPICVSLLAAGLFLGGCRPAGDAARMHGAHPDGWTGPGPVLPPQRVRMWFGGDVMQHLPQVEAARRDGGFDYSESFAALAPRMRAADIAVVNFETTLTRRGPYTGYPMFRSPTALADALCAAGVDVALLANNHCCDGGAEGLRTSIEELSRCGIRHTGAFADSADYRRNHPLSRRQSRQLSLLRILPEPPEHLPVRLTHRSPLPRSRQQQSYQNNPIHNFSFSPTKIRQKPHNQKQISPEIHTPPAKWQKRCKTAGETGQSLYFPYISLTRKLDFCYRMLI